MYLYGASGHAKVIKDILDANNMQLHAFIDDNKDINELHGVPVLHSAAECEPIIVSIGSNKIRKIIAEKLQTKFLTAIHPSAIVSASAKIEEGTVVMQGAIVQSDVVIGKHCIINTAATIDHECIIGDYAHISPNASLCGNVQIGEGTQIGVGAVVIPGVKIGKWSLVCAGSVVTHDLPDYCVAGGNRCEILRFMDKNIRGGVDSIMLLTPLKRRGYAA